MRLIWGAVIMLALSAHSWAAIAFVTAATASPGASSSFTITHTLSSGNMDAVCVGLSDTTKTVTSITDNGGSTYLLRQALNRSTNVRAELWTTSHNGVTGSPTTITVNLSGSSDAVGVSAQYSGVAQPGFIIGVQTTATNFSTIVTPAIAGVALDCIAAQGIGTFSSSGSTLRSSAVDSLIGVAVGDKTSVAETNNTTSLNLSGSEPYAMFALELQGTATGTVGGRFVQGGAIWNPSGGTPIFLFDKALTAGNLLLICTKAENTTGTDTYTDSLSNTYASALAPVTDTGAAYRMSIAYSKNIASGSVRLTDTIGVAAGVRRIAFAEYSGADAGAPIDKTSSGTGASTAADSGSQTTTFANELIYGCTGDSLTSTNTAGAGFTIRSSGLRIATEDKLVTSTSSNNAPMTVTSGNWLSLMATTVDSGQIVATPAQASPFVIAP